MQKIIDNKMFHVKWKEMWLSLSRHMCIAIIIPILIIAVIRYFLRPTSFGDTFGQLSFYGFGLLLIGLCFLATVSAFFISLLFKLASVTICDGYLQGRNYWFFRRQIPLHAIDSLRPFSNNGVKATIVGSANFGKIYIYHYTEEFDEIIRILSAYLPTDNRENA